MVKQLFGLDPRLQDLSLRVYKDSPPVLLEDEMGTLGYYGALDGAEVFVNEKKKEWGGGWWGDGVMGWWSDGVMEWWSDGVMEWWSDGVMEWWSDGVMER
jgi:hypothetical protein